MTAQLTRHLRFWDSVAINVGIVIGVGIFKTPAEVAKHLDSSGLILLAWVIGGIISLLGVFCYAELSSRFPQTGGTYVFLREAYGKFVGFLYGWAEFSINRAASIAAVAYIFASYLRNLILLPESSEKWISLATIFVFTVVNMVGLHAGIRLQHVLSIFKVLIIVSISGLVFWFGNGISSVSVSEAGRNTGMLSNFAPAMIPILWSYGGWHESTFMSGEFHDARKELPLSLIASALIVMFLYVLINFAYLKVMAPAEIAQSKAVASDALVKLFGNAGKAAITVAIIISALGALNSTILSGGRIPFAVGQDKKGLSWLGQVDPRFKTPLRALAVNGIWASVLVFLGSFEQLLFFNAFEIWLFFILVGISVFILRRRREQTNSFLMLGYPWVPILFSLVSVWICFTTVLHAPREALFGAFIILAGVPIYFLLRGQKVSIR